MPPKKRGRSVGTAKPKKDPNNNDVTDICEVEEIRMMNVQDNKAILARLMKDLKAMAPLPKPGSRSTTPRASAASGDKVVKRRASEPGKRPRRSSARYTPLTSPPLTRARTRRGSLSSGASSVDSSPNGKIKLFGGLLGSRRRELDFAEEGSDDEFVSPRRGNSKMTLEHVIRAPEDITQEELDMVAERGTVKQYDTNYGSTCHQCRQKTIDMKTICRNEECVGVRGKFCGPCLSNRYGEDVRTALKDPDWECPPCRRICNCSICRVRNGKFATGILFHLANEHGFTNVHDYLLSLRKNKA